MTDRQFTLSSGRKMGVTSVGEALAVRVVVMCHPMPGAGDFDPKPIVSRRHEVRILAFDRPGYGGSEPLRDGESAQVQARADDIAEFLMSEQMSRPLAGGPHFGAVGWGFGGAVALSLAARQPRLIARTAVVGLSRRAIENAQTQTLPEIIGRPPAPGPPAFGWDALGIDRDDPILKLPGVADRLDGMLADAAVQGTSGIETDLASVKDMSWAEELAELASPVTLIYGEDDRLTDSESGAWLRQRILQAKVARVAEARGLTIVNVWHRILERVAP